MEVCEVNRLYVYEAADEVTFFEILYIQSVEVSVQPLSVLMSP